MILNETQRLDSHDLQRASRSPRLRSTRLPRPAELSPYAPSSPMFKMEAKHYYAGLPSAPVLVARNSATPRKEPTGPETYQTVKELCPVGEHTLTEVWEGNLAQAPHPSILGIPTLGNEEVAGTLSPSCRVDTDGETEHSGKRVADICGRVGRVGGLGTGPARNDPLPDVFGETYNGMGGVIANRSPHQNFDDRAFSGTKNGLATNQIFDRSNVCKNKC